MHLLVIWYSTVEVRKSKHVSGLFISILMCKYSWLYVYLWGLELLYMCTLSLNLWLWALVLCARYIICTNWWLQFFCRAPQVYFVGETAMNLEAELDRGSKIKCTNCGKKGAALGCYAKSCRKSFHVPCAYNIIECRWDCVGSQLSLVLGLVQDKWCRFSSDWEWWSCKSVTGKLPNALSSSFVTQTSIWEVQD